MWAELHVAHSKIDKNQKAPDLLGNVLEAVHGTENNKM